MCDGYEEDCDKYEYCTTHGPRKMWEGEPYLNEEGVDKNRVSKEMEKNREAHKHAQEAALWRVAQAAKNYLIDDQYAYRHALDMAVLDLEILFPTGHLYTLDTTSPGNGWGLDISNLSL